MTTSTSDRPRFTDRSVRTLDQRLAALVRANEVRVARAALKKRLRDDPSAVLDVLDSPPEYAATMKVVAVLDAVRGLGEAKISAIQREVRFSSAKTLGGLSDRQRGELRRVLAERLR